MMEEIIKTFYPYKEFKDIKSRTETHLNGDWHETFQCIFTYRDYIFLQKRNENLTDYPGMLDVTVGGHLKYNEDNSNGVREIKEEMGISLNFRRLQFMCTLPEQIHDTFKDNEFINIFTVELTEQEIPCIHFEDQEVEDIIQIKKVDFLNFSQNLSDKITGLSFKQHTEHLFTKSDFLPYSSTYFQCVALLLNKPN